MDSFNPKHVKKTGIFLKGQDTGCPNKYRNSVTNSISSLLYISIVIPDFKSHNSIMFAKVYFMKNVKDCKDVSIMSPQDEHEDGQVYYVCILQFKNKLKHSRRNS